MFENGFPPWWSTLRKLIWMRGAAIAKLVEHIVSGTIATFVTSLAKPLKSLLVSITPVQDLNGQSNPYPPGGGKNKIELPYFSVGYCTWASLLDNETAMLAELNKLTAGDYVISGEFELTERNNTSDASKFGILFFYGDGLTQYIGNNTTPWGTSGVGSKMTYTAQATITSEMAGTFSAIRAYGCGISGQGASGKAKINKLQIESGTTATSYAPYSNICPISGRQSVTVTRSGVNVWDGTYTDGYYWSDGGVLTRSDLNSCTGKISVKESESYWLGNASAGFTVKYYDASMTLLLRQDILSVDTNRTITVPSGVKFVCVNYARGTFPADTFTLNYPSTDIDYHPGIVQSVTISLGDTIYGGTLDVTKGVLTVDRAMVTLDGTLSYSIGVGTDRNRITWNGYESAGKVNGEFVSDCLKTIPNGSGGYGTAPWQIFGSTVAPRMWITVPQSIATVNDFKTYVATNPITVAYFIASPITITLTPEQLTTVLGMNNVWSDAGDVDVTYLDRS